MGFSFGYLTIDAVKRADGVREIRKLDVFEVSATPTPMNNRTRVLSTKAVDEHSEVRTKAHDLMLELLFGDFELRTPKPHRKSTAPIKIASFECSR